MRVFVGYGYNDRDQWVEDQVFPLLDALGFEVLHGKDLHSAESLQEGVKDRIRQAEAVVGFCTLRAGQESAEYNSHPWVRDELVFALGQEKTIVFIQEEGVRIPAGLLGNRQWIPLKQADRLACIAALVRVVNSWNLRRLQIVPFTDKLYVKVRKYLKDPGFVLQYRSRIKNVDSGYRKATVDPLPGGLFLEAIGLPAGALVEIEGRVDGRLLFSSGWESADVAKISVA